VILDALTQAARESMQCAQATLAGFIHVGVMTFPSAGGLPASNPGAGFDSGPGDLRSAGQGRVRPADFLDRLTELDWSQMLRSLV
jgi:hypothetical protein